MCDIVQVQADVSQVTEWLLLSDSNFFFWELIKALSHKSSNLDFVRTTPLLAFPFFLFLHPFIWLKEIYILKFLYFLLSSTVHISQSFLYPEMYKPDPLRSQACLIERLPVSSVLFPGALCCRSQLLSPHHRQCCSQIPLSVQRFTSQTQFG